MGAGGSGGYDNSLNVNDSIFIGIGRKDCKKCYLKENT